MVRWTVTILSIVILVVALTSVSDNLASIFSTVTKRLPSHWKSFSQLLRSQPLRNMATSNATKTPVYFVSHGGPGIMYDTEHPAYSVLTRLGREIKEGVKPKAVIAISAHWESSIPDTIEINSAEQTDLIYDYYGFPAHYYKHQFPSKGSPELASKVSSLLSQANIKSRLVKRGLDHGIFASFSVLFPPSSAQALFPDIPVVQLSLPYSSNHPERYFALGKALASLRDEGVAIICSGMAVHNLRDMFRSKESGMTQGYATSFDEALRAAVEGEGRKGGVSETDGADGVSVRRERRMAALLQRPDARRAHPSYEHLWPVYVAAGAAGDQEGKRIWTKVEGSMSWGMFKFSEASKI